MPPATVDKVVVTNLERLRTRYGAAGVTAIRKAVLKLIDADAGRGLKTQLVDLASGPAMKRVKTAALTDKNSADAQANKRAIDGVFKATRPSYMMLLGAIDVIPHQDLKNPVHSADDTDVTADGDLLYACDAGYSQNVRDFLASARVVGRLPDVTGGKDPEYLVGVLETAAKWKDRPSAEYDAFLGISAEVWKASTDRSLQAVFGTNSGLKVVPPKKPPWPAAALKTLAHFINCHGADLDWRFYGQRGNDFPVAHDATQLRGKLSEGAVLAAECCYGAQLYNPEPEGGPKLEMGMCNTYLAGGAYGCFGSSTIAYGPPSGNAQADLLCQYFLRRVRDGASLGRACLEARLEFVRRAQPLTLADLKTLAQFSLMADPSVTPVRPAAPPSKMLTAGLNAEMLAAVADRAERAIRRSSLMSLGRSVASNAYVAAAEELLTPIVGAAAKRVLTPAVRKKIVLAGKFMSRLLDEAERLGIKNPSVISADIDSPPTTKAFRAGGSTPAPKKVQTVIRRFESPKKPEGVVDIRGMEVEEYDGSMETFPNRSR
jgi:hypothetical protein